MKVTLRKQNDEKASLEVSCFRGRYRAGTWAIQERWPRVGDLSAPDVRNILGGQCHLNLKARESRKKIP